MPELGEARSIKHTISSRIQTSARPSSNPCSRRWTPTETGHGLRTKVGEGDVAHLGLDTRRQISYLEWSSSVKLSEINELVRGCKHRGLLGACGIVVQASSSRSQDGCTNRRSMRRSCSYTVPSTKLPLLQLAACRNNQSPGNMLQRIQGILDLAQAASGSFFGVSRRASGLLTDRTFSSMTFFALV